MSTLYVVGCSFTRYHWPTWADIIGREFAAYENWGNTGFGNRAIVERLAELTTNRDITKDDVIIVQWTDPHRFDMHIPHVDPIEPWFLGGNILNYKNKELDWIKKYWHEASYVMHSLNFIKLGLALLNTLPCRWYITSMNDISQDLDRFIYFENYRCLFKNVNWLPPIKPFADFSDREKKTFNDITKTDFGFVVSKEGVIDDHPTPLMHYDYAKTFLEQPLGIKLDYNWVKQADDILDTIDLHIKIRDQYLDKLKWDNWKQWVRGL